MYAQVDERPLKPTLSKLIDKIIENKTKEGSANVLSVEQLVPVRNDKFVLNQCLNNMSFVAAVDPIMKDGCGFGTR